MLYFFKNTAESKPLLAEEERSHWPILLPVWSRYFRELYFLSMSQPSMATLCCPLSSAAQSELQGRASPWEMIICIFDPGCRPVNTVLDVGDESVAHSLRKLLSLYLPVFEFPLYWKHLSAEYNVKVDRLCGSSWWRRHTSGSARKDEGPLGFGLQVLSVGMIIALDVSTFAFWGASRCRFKCLYSENSFLL